MCSHVGRKQIRLEQRQESPRSEVSCCARGKLSGDHDKLSRQSVVVVAIFTIACTKLPCRVQARFFNKRGKKESHFIT